ncbi:MAG: hypothetical protein CMA85_01065 [Euryarchaeota archaeon]|nr:hypothetical protein [Euryarchaeota archaeon]
MKNPEHLFLWARLAGIVREVCEGLPVIVDEPGDLRIETQAGRPFVSVRIQRSHVGLYLLPIYYFPELLPASLSVRKSGLGTLRFNKDEDELIDEVATLIGRSLSTIGHY